MALEWRHHVSEDQVVSEAVFSDCGTYRYALSRRWSDRPALAFVMLNPSKANEKANDPTIARCQKRAQLLNFGGIEIVNLFAFCATDPADLARAEAPEGPENAHFVRRAAERAGMVLAAWGVHGAHLGQDAKALSWLSQYSLHVLGLTRQGLPRHPLYVSYAARPMPWDGASARNR
ncbi:DUF1643 domain-containing protein [Primorskyibacter sp. S187A]|uniref:DUF1643 domain-containing protein n=1 Tax=Primorskyibacter sp. S187A TaxID=3415130 RepID=UPI003C7BB72E